MLSSVFRGYYTGDMQETEDDPTGLNARQMILVSGANFHPKKFKLYKKNIQMEDEASGWRRKCAKDNKFQVYHMIK